MPSKPHSKHLTAFNIPLKKVLLLYPIVYMVKPRYRKVTCQNLRASKQWYTGV